MTTEAQSVSLRSIADTVIDRLATLDARLIPDEISFLPHTEHAKRAKDVADYLEGALTLADRQMLPAAYALLRSAMECWATDAVVLVGDRYVQQVPCESRDQAEGILTRWRDGGFTDIPELPEIIESKAGNVTVRLVRRGLRGEGDDPTILHPLYFEVGHYDPFFGTPNEQSNYPDSELFGPSDDLAQDHRRRYNTWLRWKSLVESLALNDIIPGHQVDHLATHYRFLSAFVHGHRAAIDATMAVGWRDDGETRHVLDELAVGYVCILGARYLTAFLTMADRTPLVLIDGRSEIDSLADRAVCATEHLWFLTDTPQHYDLGQELLGRAYAAKTFVRIDPATINAVNIRYFRDPLKRLREMHRSAYEGSTGFSYRSPYR